LWAQRHLFQVVFLCPLFSFYTLYI
jgi:hypothetical protein